MLVVKKTGLVPVISLARGGRDGIYGVPPDVARKGLLEHTLQLADIPNDIEVYSVAGPAEPKPEAQPEPESVVDIPEGWKELHHLARMSLAKKISGADLPKATDEQKAAGITTADLADEIITAEIQRRAAAEPPAE